MAEVTYSPTTALVVVDVQNDFADPAGSLFVEGGDVVVGEVNEHVAAARAAGATLVYTQDWHPPRTPHVSRTQWTGQMPPSVSKWGVRGGCQSWV